MATPTRPLCSLNLEHSIKYRPLDDYLIDKGLWQRERNALIERTGLGELADPCKVLAELDDALHAQYVSTNERIADGANPHFSHSARHRFTIATPGVTECRPWQQTRQHRIGERAIFAAVMGLGCGIDVSRMARIAQGVSDAEIDRAANWNVSLDNVQAANDRIIRLSANLELPQIYRREPDRLSSPGGTTCCA